MTTRKGKLTYVLQRILTIEDQEDPQPYEKVREEKSPLSVDDLKAWVRADYDNLVERRSDVKNILGTRIVFVRGGKVDTVFSVD